MVRHIVSWNFRPEVTEEKKKELYAYFAEAFPALVGKIPGVLHAEIATPPLPSSTKDMCLYVEMEKPEDIPVYANHPEHLKVAQVVRANFQDRCATDIVASV